LKTHTRGHDGLGKGTGCMRPVSQSPFLPSFLWDGWIPSRRQCAAFYSVQVGKSGAPRVTLRTAFRLLSQKPLSCIRPFSKDVTLFCTVVVELLEPYAGNNAQAVLSMLKWMARYSSNLMIQLFASPILQTTWGLSTGTNYLGSSSPRAFRTSKSFYSDRKAQCP